MTPIDLAEAADEAELGGKAVQLGAALRGGLPVPAGAALPVRLVAAVAAGDPAARARVAALPARLGGPVAARSSAVGEDSAGASFAGQHLSCLNVISGEGLIEAVCRVHASGHDAGALAYRQRRGLAGAPQVAMVVQRMVVPDAAGVLFTRDPMNGRDERVIEAAFGLGEAVVAGLVTPDRYRLDRAGRVLEQSPGHKDLAVTAAPAGGTHELAIDATRARAWCLDAARLARLAGLADACEALFGPAPQDLEWAFAGAVLHLLQRRAVTT